MKATRRKFFTKASAVAAAATLPSVASAQTRSADRPAKKGGVKNYFIEQDMDMTREGVAFLKTLTV